MHHTNAIHASTYLTVAMLLLLLLVVPLTHAQPVAVPPPLGGSIMASPGLPFLFEPRDRLSLQPVAPLDRIPVDDVLPFLAYVDPIATYVAAWHALSVGAQRAAADLTDLLATIGYSLQVMNRNRHELSQATPWLVRLFLQQAVQLDSARNKTRVSLE